MKLSFWYEQILLLYVGEINLSYCPDNYSGTITSQNEFDLPDLEETSQWFYNISKFIKVNIPLLLGF